MTENKPKMGWYNFNIYFMLFAAAVLDTMAGIEVIKGEKYIEAGTTAAAAHAQLGGWLEFFDVFFAGIFFAMAILSIITRIKLKRFEKAGIECLHFNHYIDLGASLIYHGVLSLLLGKLCAGPAVIAEQVWTLIMIIINKPYFEKREEMFK